MTHMPLIDPLVASSLFSSGWFRSAGAYVLVDGQYGSTGKGVAAALLATYLAAPGTMPNAHLDAVTSNAGPNSGHTGVIRYSKDSVRTWVNKQVPIATAVLDHLGIPPAVTYMNGGAVIAMDTLLAEVSNLSPQGQDRFFVHPHAAVVRDEDLHANLDITRKIASTGKGTGPAAAARIMRNGLTYADATLRDGEAMASLGDVAPPVKEPRDFVTAGKRILVETSQGFSLGINSGFYPHCTHRECTVAQALADARIAPNDLRRTMMVVRTYPIRVGNTENSSGGCYPDQHETTWEDVGVPPEYTTVTHRMRRVFTWSRIQFREALLVNRPDVVLLNFANYMEASKLRGLINHIREDFDHMCSPAFHPTLLLGFGPATGDVRCVQDAGF